MEALNNFVMAWWPVVAGIWTLVSGVLGLYARAIGKSISELKTMVSKLDEDMTKQAKELADYKLQVATTYMPAQDIKELVADLKAFLIRIEDKVDGRKTQ